MKIITSETISYIALGISVFSLALSGLQAYIRWVEYRRDRRNISADAYLGPDNFIRLINHSSKTILIVHWELLWRKRIWLFWKRDSPIQIYDDEDLYLEIPARKKHDLTFEEPYTFNWGSAGRGDLYMKLYVDNLKRPIYKRVL